MNENNTIAENNLVPAQEEKKETPVTPEPLQNPVKAELERVQKKSGRTKEEKLLFTYRKVKEQIKDLGLPVDDEETPVSDDDSAPVTVGMLKKLEQERGVKTAIQLADSISDLDDRELAKFHIQNTIRPSGNAEEDLRNALALVHSVKNTQIAQEVLRINTPKSFSNASGAPAKTEIQFQPTAEELVYMSAPFNLKKEDIIRARQQNS